MSIFRGYIFEPLRNISSNLARSRAGRIALSIDENAVNDERFWDQLSQVRALKRFLFQESVAFKATDLPHIGLEQLEAISFHTFGRTPNAQEWAVLDSKQSVLSSYLDARLRWKLKLSQLRVFFTTIPVIFLLIAVVALGLSLVRSIFFETPPSHLAACVYSAGVILWTLALGGLGACAFLGTTMISESARVSGLLRASDANAAKPLNTDFDLTDRDLIWTRIVVGILFAFLLGIPLSAGSVGYVEHQIAGGNIMTVELNQQLLQNITLTLLPFVIGFSTTLVLGVMDRCVATIRTVLGMTAQ